MLVVGARLGAADKPREKDKGAAGFTVEIDSWSAIVAGMDEEQSALQGLYGDNQIKANARWKADNESLKKSITGKAVRWDLRVVEISATKVTLTDRGKGYPHDFTVGIPIGSGTGEIRKDEAEKLTAGTDTLAIKGKIKSAGFESGRVFDWSCLIGDIDVDRRKK